MDILEYIGKGKSNAIKRRDLADITGLTDRETRRAINEAKKREVIINAGDGKGYFVYDADADGVEILEAYVMKERARIKELHKALALAELTLKYVKDKNKKIKELEILKPYEQINFFPDIF